MGSFNERRRKYRQIDLGAVDPFQDHFGVSDENFRSFGEPDSAADTFEQFEAGLALQRREILWGRTRFCRRGAYLRSVCC
ncbi:MAG TPA: hypothetical protein VIW24_15175 [Aldersonia sp.]